MNTQLSGQSAELKNLQLRGKKFMAAVGGVVLGLLTIAIVTQRSPLPTLDAERFAQAQRAWDERGPASYEIEIQVHGRQAATYFTEIKNREVVQATRNGAPLRQQRTIGTWSVPGMFGTMQSDVENLEKHRAGQAGPETPRVALRCVFDPEFGYPARYHRIEMAGSAGNVEVSWDVVRFTPR